MAGFAIEYVILPNGRMPGREFVDSLGEDAAAKVYAFIERLRSYGTWMQGKFVRKLTKNIFELRVKHFDRIFRVLFFYQPGMLIVITSGFQKKNRTDAASRDRAGERLRGLWLRYRNRYPESNEERQRILREVQP